MAHQLDALTFPLHGMRLIEASAGTGKTYTIAALYLRLVLGHGGENGFTWALMPPEILVVTFTNAATEELRDRIRRRLTEGASFFRGNCDGDPYLKSLRGEYPQDEWPGRARVLDQAAQWMDESAIHTIHAWCQRMLRQHAFDSGSLFDLELETSDQALLEEASCDYWRCHFYPQPMERLADMMEHVKCSTPHQLLSKVRPLFGVSRNSEEGPQDPFDLLDERRKVVEGARKEWEVHFDEGVRLVQEAQADKTLNGNKYRTASLKKWLGQLSGWVHEGGSLPDEQALEKLSRTGLEAGLSKNKSAPEHPAFEIFDRLVEELRGLEVNTALFNHAAYDIDDRFQKEKHRRAQMGFDDLLIRLNQALLNNGNDRLAKVIAKQFPVALIDEFQDTDPIQYTTFRKIYLERPETGLFMIGDPKQAIYAFRGADIHTYLEARRDTSDNHYTLGKNYRSTSGVVNSVNRMFQAAVGHPEGAFMFRDEIPFENVDAQGRKEDLLIEGETVSGMTLWQLEQDEPVSKRANGGYLDQMAESTASEITRLLNLASKQQAGFKTDKNIFTSLCPADIAVLVRDGNEAGAIRRALDARGVRSVYLSDKESVFDTEEANSLLYLLRACTEPEEEGSLRTALATSILALPLAQLDYLNQDELAWEAEVERFRNFQRIWQTRGVLPMLRTLFNEFAIPARLLAEISGERLLTNLLHLAEMLQVAASSLDGEQALLRWLAEQIQDPGNGSDDQILRLESDEDLVRVITIHKSKGLEYPLVFLPFICSFREVTKSNSTVVKYHDADGRLKLIQNPQDEDLEAADRERLAEDLRMLYVAVTRPRYACWLGLGVLGTNPKSGEKSKLHLSGLGYLLSSGGMIPTAELASKLADLKGDCKEITIMPLPAANDDEYKPLVEDIELAQAKEFTGKVPRNWWITSYSGILAGASMSDALPQEGGAGEIIPDSPDSAAEDQLQEAESEASAAPDVKPSARSIHRFPRGPEPGTFLHSLLEWTAKEGFDAISCDRKRILERVTMDCSRRGWTDWAAMLTDWIVHLLQTPLLLPENQGSMALSELSREEYQPELEFMFAAHKVNTTLLDNRLTDCVLPGARRPRLRENRLNGMLKGFIDLVFCHNGRYYILDYKSNYLGEDYQAYLPDTMTEGMLEHRYDLQYVLYTLALHRLLKTRLPDYDYEKDMGGVIYLFLRGVNGSGQGVYNDKPPRELIETLDNSFAGKEDNHAA